MNVSEQEYDVRHDRVRYELARVDAAALAAEPIAQFGQWLRAAADGGVSEPNAMVLATADGAGTVRARTVLLRGYENGFTFFTNYHSIKGQHLAQNPRASACFSWVAIHRQVIVEGTVEKVSHDESAAYFSSRPLPSQAASASSPQSQVIKDIAQVEADAQRLIDQHPDGVPLPEHWGGYRLIPDVIEFWQGNVARMHDRFRYRRDGEGWICERLAP